MANKFSYLYSLHMNKISEDYDIYANRLFIPTPTAPLHRSHAKPLNAELERLRAQLVAAEHNAHELREQLGMKPEGETSQRIAARMPRPALARGKGADAVTSIVS